MKFGSVAWGYTPIPEDMPNGDSLERIADKAKAIGFDIIDYLSTYESLDEFFDTETCKRIGSYVKSIGMEVGGLVFQSDLWNNPDQAVIDKQLKYFEKCVSAASNLGAWAISCIIPPPFGSKGNPRPSPSDKLASNLPANYSWEKDWNLFATNLRKAANIAAKEGISIALECFPRSLCSTPNAMLQIVKDVNEKNFGIQLDTAHLMNQNIDVETAIFMLGTDNILNVHAKDSDGLTRTNLAPGTGIVDYKAVLRALNNIGYKRNISVEVEFTTDPETYMRLGLEHLKWCLERL